MIPLLNADKIYTYFEEVAFLFDSNDGVKTIGEFVKQINHLSNKYVDPIDPTDDKINTFKGDMFELLGEIFFNGFSNDPAVGIRDYEVVPLDEDYGVDAIGTNANGDRVAVQYKFKSKPMDSVEYAAIARTYAAGRRRHKLDLDKPDTIWLVTTGNGTTGPCKEVFGDSLRVIYRDILAGKIDNNMSFWKGAEEQIEATLNSHN